MITIQPEKLRDVQEDVQTLLQEHYAELTLHKDVVKLDVDWCKYLNLERMGMLAIVVARDDGRAIGYSAFLLHMHMHYQAVKFASNDVLFLSKPYRKGTSVGSRLLKVSEARMLQLGAQKITWHVKESNDWSAILLRKGYVLEESVYSKGFGKP